MTQTLLEKIKLAEEKMGKDWLKELGDCKTKQQLKTKVDGWGIGLSEQETEEAFGLLSNKKGELSDEELKNYAGGLLVDLTGLDTPPPPKTDD